MHGYAQLMEQDPRTGRFEYIGNPGESFRWYIGAALYRRVAFERTGLFDPDLRFGRTPTGSTGLAKPASACCGSRP